MLTKFYEFISSETIFPILFGVPLFFRPDFVPENSTENKTKNQSFNQNASIREL